MYSVVKCRCELIYSLLFCLSRVEKLGASFSGPRSAFEGFMIIAKFVPLMIMPTSNPILMNEIVEQCKNTRVAVQEAKVIWHLWAHDFPFLDRRYHVHSASRNGSSTEASAATASAVFLATFLLLLSLLPRLRLPCLPPRRLPLRPPMEGAP